MAEHHHHRLWQRWAVIGSVAWGAGLPGCATSYVEMQGECVLQQWSLAGFVVRRRMLCDLPPPKDSETPVRDREEGKDANPFPGLFENNKADSVDPDLLEKNMEYPQNE